MGLQTYKAPQEIAHGQDGVIFKIAKDLVAKIGYFDSETKHESEIAGRLYKAGISVPIPYGMHQIEFPNKEYSFKLPFKEGGIFEGFVMERIVGKTGFELGILSSEMKEAMILLNEEIRKAIEMGFQPKDEKYFGNFIFTSDEKIKLLDFTSWSYRDILVPQS